MFSSEKAPLKGSTVRPGQCNAHHMKGFQVRRPGIGHEQSQNAEGRPIIKVICIM